MIERMQRSLMIAQLSVFFCVLLIFSMSVYFAVCRNEDKENLSKLNAIWKTAALSLEREPNEVLNLLVEYGKEHSAQDQVSFEWFDIRGHLQAFAGVPPLTMPLARLPRFDKIAHPPMLLETQPVVHGGMIVGFLRVGISLRETEQHKKRLLQGLLLGMVIASVASAFLVMLLVRHALHPVKQSVQQLSDFTSFAAHELKGPVAAIKTNAFVLLDDEEDLSLQQAMMLRFVLSAANQINGTITDLLTLAYADYTTGGTVQEHTNLEEVLDELEPEFILLASENRVVVERVAKIAGLTCSASRAEVRIILLNLIKNAIQFSKKDGKVIVWLYRVGQKVRIGIVDYGIGIKAEDLPKVFDRFWRSDESRTYKEGGNGLGLAIVQTLVHRNQGSIEVSSEFGEGTSFVVSLPM